MTATIIAPAAVDDTAAILRNLAWLRMRGIAENTIQTRRYVLTRLRAGLGQVTLLAADADALAAWRADMTALTPSTIANYVSHARQFYDWTVKTGLREESPATELAIPKRRRRLPRPIAETDLFTALAAASPRARIWLVLAGWVGLRAQEIARLHCEDIRAHATPPVLIVTSYAAKGGHERIVPLAPFVLAELAAAGLPRTGWLFPHCSGRGPVNPWTVSCHANEALHGAGVAATLHQLRHRFGTQVYRASGRDLRMTQDLLGHADPATTSIYAAWDRAQAPEAVGAVPCPPRRVGVSDSG